MLPHGCGNACDPVFTCAVPTLVRTLFDTNLSTKIHPYFRKKLDLGHGTSTSWLYFGT